MDTKKGYLKLYPLALQVLLKHTSKDGNEFYTLYQKATTLDKLLYVTSTKQISQYN